MLVRGDCPSNKVILIRYIIFYSQLRQDPARTCFSGIEKGLEMFKTLFTLPDASVSMLCVLSILHSSLTMYLYLSKMHNNVSAWSIQIAKFFSIIVLVFSRREWHWSWIYMVCSTFYWSAFEFQWDAAPVIKEWSRQFDLGFVVWMLPCESNNLFILFKII